ncbi:9210_t:CDS:2, partial [Gigaspora rosea]
LQHDEIDSGNPILLEPCADATSSSESELAMIGMTKIRAYYMANIQSELTYFDAELTEFELYTTCNTNIEDDVSMNLNPKDHVNTVLSVELDIYNYCIQ